VYVIGIDPPNGWAAWGSMGIIAWGQSPSRTDFREKRNFLYADIQAFLAKAPLAPAIVAIEAPFGGARGGDGAVEGGMLKALVDQADSGGWFEAKFDTLCSVMRPMGNQWRSALGLRQSPRDKAKAHAIKLASKAVAETSALELKGERGGKQEHAADAICIALATWHLHSGWNDNIEDAYRRFVKTGSFVDPVAAQGGTHGTAASEGRDSPRVGDDGEAAVGTDQADRGTDRPRTGGA
jgi:hypothetical protein